MLNMNLHNLFNNTKGFQSKCNPVDICHNESAYQLVKYG